MRAILIVMFLTAFTAFTAEAQKVQVGRTSKVPVPDNREVILSGVSPDGRYLLISDPGYKGLYLMDIRGRRAEMISDSPGAGYEPSFSSNGSSVVFRTDEFVDGKKYSSLKRYEVATGETRILVDHSRNLTAPSVSGERQFWTSAGRLESSDQGTLTTKSYVSDTILLLEDLTPVLWTGGEKQALKPNGEGSYIWASLSPDKMKILYYFTGKGAFICDLDGNILFSPGRISAPKWLTNQVIIGMDDRDDGHNVTGSEIVSFSLGSGNKTYLTSTRERREMYPFPFPGGRRIALQTAGGEIFIMKIRIRN